MKINFKTNHFIWKIGADQYFPKVSRFFLFEENKKATIVYFGVLDTT
ncbi:hypothetical protein SAMN05444671_0988 [Flavobacterium sp. CF108]|nr:hypothetical protein SAMN04487978_0738 [Flavobacterium sp. fv08]SHG62076.1 hypothetical protein SAMN05444671_0988 [Flavobacterium sp. CF108]